MNGRELTAKDIEFTFLRDFGMGSGATEPNPFYEAFHGIPVESIEATGDNNLVVKLSTPGHVLDIQWLLGVGETPTGLIVPPEVIKQSGDIQDWENVVGTGPYEITAFQPGASLTLTKNPNYWQIDPIHPGLDNRLPYVDEIRLFVIDDSATRPPRSAPARLPSRAESTFPWNRPWPFRTPTPSWSRAPWPACSPPRR